MLPQLFKTNHPLPHSSMEWLDEPYGRYLVQWQRGVVDRMTPQSFGYYSVQFGMHKECFLRNTVIANKIIAVPRQSWQDQVYPSEIKKLLLGGFTGGCVFEWEHLPLMTHNFDLIVLPNILETLVKPHHFLRQINELLVVEGHLIITGVNPMSLFGSYEWLWNREHAKRLISVHRLKIWLELLGMTIIEGSYGCYRNPFAHGKEKSPLSRFSKTLEYAGDRWWPTYGGSYILHAVKREQHPSTVGLASKRLFKPKLGVQTAKESFFHLESNV